MTDCYRETHRTARKPHRCCECMATIDPGERYVVCSGVSEGEGWAYKLCAFCCALAEQARGACEVPEEDGPTFCGLYGWLSDLRYGLDADPGVALLDGMFPLVAEAREEHDAEHYAALALRMSRGSRGRGAYLGRRLAAQVRLRALRASRWTVDGRAA